MTMTQEVKAAETLPVTILASSAALVEMLGNAALFTARGTDRPVLRHVRLEVKGGRLSVEATDSYAAYREWLEVEQRDGEAGVAYVTREEATGLAKAIKAAKSQLTTLTVGERVTVEAGNATQIVGNDGYAFEWPNIEQLWPRKLAELKPEEGLRDIGLSGDQFTRLGKIKVADHARNLIGAPFRFTFNSSNLKPFVVTIEGCERVEILVMPARLA